MNDSRPLSRPQRLTPRQRPPRGESPSEHRHTSRPGTRVSIQLTLWRDLSRERAPSRTLNTNEGRLLLPRQYNKIHRPSNLPNNGSAQPCWEPRPQQGHLKSPDPKCTLPSPLMMRHTAHNTQKAAVSHNKPDTHHASGDHIVTTSQSPPGDLNTRRSTTSGQANPPGGTTSPHLPNYSGGDSADLTKSIQPHRRHPSRRPSSCF